MREYVLGVDLDAVCADYNSALRQVASVELDVPLDELTTEAGWDFGEWGLDNQSFQSLHRKAVQEYRIFRDMPVIDGASEALWRLSDAGVWIRVITHRLGTNWGHELIVSDTVAWLDAQRIPYRDLCFLGRKPEVQADVYVDDAPHNIEALRAGDNQVIVFDQPYNRDLAGPRARDWAEVEMIIAEMVTEAGRTFEVQFPGIDPGAERLDRRKGS